MDAPRDQKKCYNNDHVLRKISKLRTLIRNPINSEKEKES